MQNSKSGGFLSATLKSVVLAVLITLASVLVFSLVVKNASLGTNAIKSVNQFIKVVSVFVGCFFMINGRLGFVKGAVSGLVYSVVVYLVFALISGSSPFTTQLLIDCVFTCIVGSLSGVVAVNRRTAA